MLMEILHSSHTHTHTMQVRKLNSDMFDSMDCYCSYEAEPVLKLMHFKLEIDIAYYYPARMRKG